MAKMFYTLEETAAALNLTDDDIRQMATEGKLQQFRDRDNLMFKREQVDKLAPKTEPQITEDDQDTIPLAGSSINADAISLQDSGVSETGISIFETGEFDLADPSAATQISDSGELGLEIDASAASGSGLMDLANDDSDDTNLGAVMLDASGQGSTFGSGLGSGLGSSLGGSGLGSSLGDSAFSASGLGESALDASALGASAFAEATGMGIPSISLDSDTDTAPQQVAAFETDTPSAAASGFVIGTLLVACLAIIATLYASFTQANQTTNIITQTLTSQGLVALYYALGAIVVAIILGAICGFIGKSVD